MSLVLGMLLDAVFGEPQALWRRVPHPAVIMGRAVSWCDRRFNQGDQRRLRGVMVLVGLVAAAIVLGQGIAALGWLAEALALAVVLAQKSLVDHVGAVAAALRLSLAEGRRAVAMIVGRDVTEMDGSAVARAAIESAAENFSDGVAAPVFWYLLGGLPGMLAYKMVNTADSMIGYRTERHAAFGWAAARLDDVMNLIPARLSGVMFTLLAGQWRDWPEIVREARLHRSPNAGWPEAAMARALGVALSGPRSYHGEMRDYPWVNGDGARDIGPTRIDAACVMLWKGWAVLLAGAQAVWIF